MRGRRRAHAKRSFVASASAGLPVWPAAMLVDQAPVRFASEELLGR